MNNGCVNKVVKESEQRMELREVSAKMEVIENEQRRREVSKGMKESKQRRRNEGREREREREREIERERERG
jgi:squalene cyclase